MGEEQVWTPLELESELVGGPEELVARLTDLGDELDTLLVQERALVFRGFGVTPDALDEVLALLLPGRTTRRPGGAGRAGARGDVCAAHTFPRERLVPPHSELSHAHAWPSRLVFYCEAQPSDGGATLVVDTASWLASLDAEVREAFTDGVRYVRELRNWQGAFRTGRREDVEALLDGAGAAWRWRADGGLRIEVARPATVRHPVTGVEVWFNQADQWPTGGLGGRSVTFADGGPIPAEYLRQIRDRGLGHAVDVQWRTGDLLLVDNVLVAHGRRPFTGHRRVPAAMSE